MKTLKHRLIASAAVLGLAPALSTTSASAQSASGAADGGEGSGGGLAEIVVTAQRRVENQQDAPRTFGISVKLDY